jgi:hypothetical protein
MDSKVQAIRDRAEADLETFIKLVHPQRVLGSIHTELIQWWTKQDAKSHQLVLLPRDHMKSALVAYRVAWEITKNPAIRILYISSTSQLAIKQAKFIKDILTCPQYRRYWPEMVHPDEGMREKWAEKEFSVDHPLRKAEAIRDPTVFTAGLTSNIVGMHCDIAVMDDIIVDDNAYSEEGREKVRSQYSLLASIEGAQSLEWVVGTRYHPSDLYYDLMGMEVENYDPVTGELIASEPLYEVFERQVETIGDGTGEYLWPKQQRYDGKWFGFDQAILARKKAQYLDSTKFRAQYYNDPNDPADAPISNFQYYDQRHLIQRDGRWFMRDKRLNIYAAVDFAYSLQRRADYTCIAVCGVDADQNYYVLEIDRFKTDKISDYFEHIMKLHMKWDFRKIRAEITAAQDVIVKELKNNYVRRYGLALVVEDFRPTRYMGSKEERVDSILQPKYENGQVWHYMGGNCQTLEEELKLRKPPHDDCKDALASAIDSAIAPTFATHMNNKTIRDPVYHSRFGGII